MDDDANCRKAGATRRRISIENSKSTLMSRIDEMMDRLKVLWDEVHMDQETRESRVTCAYMHFYTLLDDIVKSEENMVSGVKSDIEAHRLTVADIRTMLKMAAFDETPYQPNSIALLKALGSDLETVAKKRDDAIEAQLEEYDALKAVCERLDVDVPIDFLDVKTKIMSMHELAHLKAKRRSMIEKLERRITEINAIQAECRKMYKSVKETTSFSAEHQNLLNSDFAAPSAHVGNDVLENFERLQATMCDAYTTWHEHLAFQYSEMLIAYREAAEKCGIEESYPLYPDHFDPKIHDQSTVDKLGEEVHRMQGRYERGASVFDAFMRWRELWREKLLREEEASHPQFYNNRGGQLSAFLKRQKQLGKLVPQALDHLITMVMKFTESNGDVTDILINDLLPDEYADFLESEYNEQKKSQKSLKAATPNNTSKMAASRIGAGSRRVSGRLKVLSGKVARRRMSHRFSIISPVKSTLMKSSAFLQGGPKTSSPRYLPSPLIKFATPRTPVTPGAQSAASSSKFLTPLSSLQSPKSMQTLRQRTSRLPTGMVGARSAPRPTRHPHINTTPSMASSHTLGYAAGPSCSSSSAASTSRLPLRQMNNGGGGSRYASTTKLAAQTPKTPHWKY